MQFSCCCASYDHHRASVLRIINKLHSLRRGLAAVVLHHRPLAANQRHRHRPSAVYMPPCGGACVCCALHSPSLVVIMDYHSGMVIFDQTNPRRPTPADACKRMFRVLRTLDEGQALFDSLPVMTVSYDLAFKLAGAPPPLSSKEKASVLPPPFVPRNHDDASRPAAKAPIRHAYNSTPPLDSSAPSPPRCALCWPSTGYNERLLSCAAAGHVFHARCLETRQRQPPMRGVVLGKDGGCPVCYAEAVAGGWVV